ncbi:Nitrogenase component 1 type Oxidoreductase [Ruminococcus sp. YE71]|uniref:nitrogenase component 1 n=1 Tax=unclassified Ruminococcus TaxID=2608920 RepID=UPI00088C5974|nr:MULTISPECIES: nitrogenase component 1 [unclassified Ruminococcus]SDA12056.1 Nitrogenase component 1 type Oxidoreductase [Ruminococcus sp. YE78]SFW16176.1 Nitrogenase component 1 type Oxidoreductase [Ruminococcus sp. YE71]
MKNVSKIIPCYSADTAGVCSALYELGGMVVTHDASGCNSTYATHDEPRWYDIQSKMYISALTEMDAIMGNDEKLISDIVSAANDQKPEFIAVCGSPMPMMTGVDFDAIAAEIESRTDIPTFGMHTNGTHSYIEGASEAFDYIVKQYVRECPKTEGSGVNIIGMTPLDFKWRGTMDAVKGWLAENGLEYVSCIAMGSSLDEIRRAASASVNLVVSSSGLAAAKYMEERFGIPYVCGVPYGRAYAKAFAEQLKGENGGAVRTADDADTVIIGEGIGSVSLAAALSADLGISAKVICPLTCGDGILADTDLDLYAEEDIEAALSDMDPKTVIADPLYKYIVPDGTRFIELPHFAFSGRCFERDMKDLINTDIKEYFK